MKTIFFLHFLIFSYSFSWSQNVPARMEGDQMINDYSEKLSETEKDELETLVHKIRLEHQLDCYFLLLNDRVKNDVPQFASTVAKEWQLSENAVLIVADVHQAAYGFYVGKNLSSLYPSWVLEKIENNQLKINFRDQKYYEGIQEVLTTVDGLKTGIIKQDDLRKEESGSGLFILLVVLCFFIVVFPILQYQAMKRSHFSSRPVDFVSSVLLMNYFGTRGKNVFDNFSRTQGVFVIKNRNFESGGGGVSGNW